MLDTTHAPTLPRRSRSSLVRALLLTQVGEARSLPERFTTREVCAALGLQHPDGAVSGWLSRAVECGMLRQVARDAARCVVLEIADLRRVPSVRLAPGAGSRPGRTHRGSQPTLPGLEPASAAPGSGAEPPWARVPAVPPPPAPAASADADGLRALVERLTRVTERLEQPVVLRDVPTEELLAELGRRAGLGAA
jgi:hypothetical protein